MVTVTLANQKGGVGKTSTCLSLGTGLNDHGYKVLMVDLDAQSNLSFGVGIDLLGLTGKTLFDVFSGKASIDEAIYPVRIGLDIAVGGMGLSMADMTFTGIGREYLLKKALAEVSERYDFCIVDTSPYLAVLSMNALAASDQVVIPMFADAYSLQGLAQLSGFIENVREYLNKDLQISGLLITRYDRRSALTKALEGEINTAAERIGTKVFQTRIRNAAAMAVSQLTRTDIYHDAPKSGIAEDYRNFVNEFLSDLNEGR